jgi:hypothetical protein
MRLQVHWATVAIIVLSILFVALAPLLFDVFDHSLVDASVRADLAPAASALAAKLYCEAKLPSITMWSSPAASYGGQYSVWLGSELHIVLRNDIDAMPESARSFALAHAIDSAISARGIGWRRLARLGRWLPLAAALLLSALFGDWVLLGSCLWVMVPMVAFLLLHRVKRSTSASYFWPDKRQLAIDQRAAWATGGMTGARAWYTERMAASEGFAREMLKQRLSDLERTQ